MARTTDDFFRLAGGFRIGETHDEIRKRIDEIVDLEAALNVADIKNTDAERIKRRLRQLKDVDAVVS